MNELQEGVEINAVRTERGTINRVSGGVVQIVVRMQPDGAGMSPWIEVVFESGRSILMNPRYCSEIEFAERREATG